MNKIILKLILIFSLNITLGCGFTVVDKSIKNFSVKEIKTSGEKRINFKIKNNILSNVQDNQETSLLLNIDTKKIKGVKEKNIKNQITKYQITINVEINYKTLSAVLFNNELKWHEFCFQPNFSLNLNSIKRFYTK